MGPSVAVAAVRGAVRASIADLPAGALVLAACSGGADSLALATALAFEAPRAGLRAGAVTVDHGLQAGSAQRAAALCGPLADLGLEPVAVETVRVGTAGGPEAAARSARYTALRSAASRLGASAVLLGHTRDDQAETVLLRLARGSGTRSLAGIPPVSGPGGLFRRPLLGVARSVTVQACADAGLAVWHDPHNDDPAYTRSRVRGEVLPVLERALGPGVVPALARSARLARADAEALDGWAARELAAAGTGGGLECRLLEALPEAVRTRVLHQWALAAGCPPGALAASHVRALDELVTDWRGQTGVDLPGRRKAIRRYGKLYLVVPRGAERD